MKPIINDSKCGASKNGCKVIKICPVNAISYIEVDEPILDKNVNCGCNTDTSNDCGCGCDCETETHGKIIIDYDKCIECGACVNECCAKAIDY